MSVLLRVLGFLSDLGDQDVTFPIILGVGLALLFLGQVRNALVWLAVLGCGLLTMLVLKLDLEACGDRVGQAVYSPSGHTFAATAVYGAVVFVLTWRRGWALVAAVLVALVIGWSRVALGCHTVPEVVIGGTLGVLAVWVLAVGMRPMRVSVRAWWGLVAGVCLVMVLLHGYRSPAERIIQEVAHRDIAPWLRCSRQA